MPGYGQTGVTTRGCQPIALLELFRRQSMPWRLVCSSDFTPKARVEQGAKRSPQLGQVAPAAIDGRDCSIAP